MKLLLTLCFTCALLITAESLNCHVCANQNCSTSTSVACPAFSVCSTVTLLRRSGTSTTVTVNKNCSTLPSCPSLLGSETEWSVNQGFAREARRQLCCITNDCNMRTLAVPNSVINGRQCPGCASSAESLNGSCNATVSCEGVEDRCFNSTTLNSTQLMIRGCISNNLCVLQAIFGDLLSGSIDITCGAPCSYRMSTLLLTFAVAAHKVLL
ncbi:uncharacterized protein LOC141810197 [Halichoeres trimaculatus]|uniref:uncharacterized protein LOC141810197 n=1 Tax=Halichoeres trimaculatus TaxID=147232 RepID=UPI003D9F2540